MTDQEANRAREFLVDSAFKIGRAHAETTKADAMLKHVKALAMKASGETSLGAQEREALASNEYLAAIESQFEATKKYRELLAAREAALATIQFWQSWSANNRGATR